MHELYGQCRGAMVLLHGGAGAWDATGPRSLNEGTLSLRKIAAKAIDSLRHGNEGLDVVVECLKAMELDELFNAGRGAALQSDGQTRLTAAIMDGPKQTFSGVISASYVTHPSVMARHLQGQSSRVLTTPGTELLARELGLPTESALSSLRVKAWTDRLAKGGETFCDTVGALIRMRDGRLYAGTSTGGRGFEFPGRVSDSGTVAGTYCTKIAAISATGIGEQIVDDALAARLETRRRDGATLEAASRLCLKEAMARGHAYGWIAQDAEGFWAVAHNTPTMTFVVHSEEDGEASSSFRA